MASSFRYGTPFDDLLDDAGVSSTVVTFAGGLGNDTYSVLLSRNNEYEVLELPGEGVDTFRVQGNGTDFISLEDLPGIENLEIAGLNFVDGNAQANLIRTIAGTDGTVFDGRGGRDTLIGGAGDDTYRVNDSTVVIVELTGEGRDLVRTSVSYVLPAGVENAVVEGASAVPVSVTGNALDNEIEAFAGRQRLAGLAGNDTLSAGEGDDTLQGGDGNDSLFGSNGADLVEGGAGADTIAGGADNDTLVGGAGDDSYSVVASIDVVIEAAGGGTDRISANATVFVLPANVEILLPAIGGSLDFTGNTGANHITGAGSADVLRGLAGDDRLDGAGGNDTLAGDLGNDTLDGGTGTDSLIGGAGNDEYRVDATGDTVVEAVGAGRDRVWSSVAVFALPENVEELLLVLGSAASIGRGNALDNVLIGNEASNQLEGGAGNDRLDGGRDPGEGPTDDDGAPDILIGGLGNDTFVVSEGDIAVEAADGGRDLLIMTGQWGETGPYFMPAHIEDATFLVAEGNAFIGNALANRITGSADEDSIDGGGGSDTLAGGGGDDSYDVNLATDVVVEAVGAGFDTVFASSSFVLPANVEQLVFRAGAQPLPGATRVVGTGNTGADRIDAGELATSAQLSGVAGNDSLTGGSAADTLQGGAGNDTLAGGAGPNRLEGGAGDDVYQVTDATDVIVELANDGRDRIEALFNSPGFVLPANVEDLTITEGVSFSTALGNGLDNRILGNAGFNTLNGLAGNDLLDGGGATDFMTGGPGNDTYVVDDDGDTTAEDANGGIDLIRSTISIVLGAGRENIENVELLDTAASAVGNALGNRITGNGGTNTLAGSGGDDRLEGREGNDSLDGGSGRDTMVGGAGNDTYAVDQVTDVVIELAGEGNDQIFLSVPGVAVFTLPNHVESLVNLGGSGVRVAGNALDNSIFGGAGVDTLDGGAGNDTLSGSTLDDVLAGGAGNDRLDGGAGADAMTGGAGDDTYVVTTGDGLGGGGQLVTEDRIIELAGGGIDKVQFGSGPGNYVLPDHVENLESLAGPTSFAITGNALDNELKVAVTQGNVSLAGGAGNDLLSALGVETGATVALSFDGGPGQDRLVLGLSGPGASLFTLGIEETTFQVAAGTTTLSNGGGLLAGRVVMQGPGSLTLNASSSVRDYVFNGYSGTLVATGTGSVQGGERASLELRGANTAGFTAADLERFDITTTGTAASTLNLAGNSSLATLVVQGTAGLTVQNFGTSMTNVVLRDFTGGNNLVLLPVSAVNADLVTVTPDGSFGGIDFTGYGTDGNTFVFALTSSAAPSLLQAFGMSAGSAVSVTGAGELDLRGFEAGIVNVTASGVLAFELGAVAGATFDATLASAASIRVTGGAGNDTLSFGSSLDSLDHVDGGAGTDTLNAIVTGLRAATTGRLDVGSSVENFNATVGSGGGVTETSLDGSDIRAGGTSILNGTGAASALLRVVNASGAWDGFSNGGFDGRLDIRASAFASDVNFNGGDGDDTLTGADADDILFGGGGSDLLRGGGGADQILGGNGNDALFGEAGDDLLAAGLGLDGMTGGAGADSFQFDELNGASNTANADTITDFEPGVDKLQFENATFTGLAAGALAAGAFRSGAGVSTAGDADDRIIYNTSNGKLFYDSDGLGGAAAVEVATLLGNGGFALPPVITAADIFVV